MSEISEVEEDKILQNENIRNVLENYTTVMMHKDLVVKLKEYSIIKGKDWEDVLFELLERELGEKPATQSENGESPEKINKINTKRFKL